jgi:ubiquinone/menaquinone biosynthesis C-methylase UbiE
VLKKEDAMEKPDETITGFDRVDQAANPAFFTQFMDKSHTLQSASIYRQRMFDLLDVRPGAVLLDVGCGAGNDVQDLAKLVGLGGRVVGIDSSATMIQQARARTADGHLPVEYLQGDAYQLPFEENSFDGCLSSRIFKHLAEPGRALGEMLRVARLNDIVLTSHVLSIDYAYFQMVFSGLLQEAQAAGQVEGSEVTRWIQVPERKKTAPRDELSCIS